MGSSSRGERLLTWSRLNGLRRRADSAWWPAVDWSAARGWSRARQDGQHVAPVRGGGASEKQRGKAATCALPDAIFCAARSPGFCRFGRAVATTLGPFWIHARGRRLPRNSAARLLDHMPREGRGRRGHRAVGETGSTRASEWPGEETLRRSSEHPVKRDFLRRR